MKQSVGLDGSTDFRSLNEESEDADCNPFGLLIYLIAQFAEKLLHQGRETDSSGIGVSDRPLPDLLVDSDHLLQLRICLARSSTGRHSADYSTGVEVRVFILILYMLSGMIDAMKSQPNS